MHANDTKQHDFDDIALGGELTESQAKSIFALGEEAVVFALLKQAKMMAEKNLDKQVINSHDDPSCPSGQKPPYAKPNTKKKTRRKRMAVRRGIMVLDAIRLNT